MIVCLCHNICDRRLRAEVAAGARSVAEVAACSRAGTDCGACLPLLRQTVAQLAAEESRRQRDDLCAPCLPITGEGCHEGA